MPLRLPPVVAVALASLVATACARDRRDGLERVRAAGVLRWGGDLAGGEPYVYEDPEHPGMLLGFEADLARSLARSLGVRAEFVQTEWSQLVPALERGSIDVILNGLEASPRLAERVRLSRPYYVFAERLVARKDDARFAAPIAAVGPAWMKSPSPLDGLRVGTLGASLAHDLLRGTRADIVINDMVDAPYRDLALGRLDAVLLDDIIATRYGTDLDPTLAAVGDVGQGRYVAAVRAGDARLHDAVDAALGEIIVSGELMKILGKRGLWNDRQAVLGRDARPIPDLPAGAVGATLAVAAPPSPRGGLAGLFAAFDPSRFHIDDLVLFLKGAVYTLGISIAAMAIAIPFGILLALARRYGPRPLSLAAAAYVEVLRGTPVLLQLYVLYYGLADVVLLGPLTAAVVGLGLNYAAYEAEVYRGGIQAVPPGQLEAAHALGMSTTQALRRVLLPQAFRLALPGVTNDFIALLKDSSLVSVITVVELTKRTQIAAIEGRSWLLPGLLCAGLYFLMSFPLSRVARRLEARS